MGLSSEALERERSASRTLREQRLTLESEIAIARRLLAEQDESEATAIKKVRRLEARLAELDRRIKRDNLRVFGAERRLLDATGEFLTSGSPQRDELVRRGIRGAYALADLDARFNRRELGENISFVQKGITDGEEDKLAARARALIKEIVLPLRASPTELNLQVGQGRSNVANIDQIRGRFISSSVLSNEVFQIEVFVSEYNRVFHSGKCTIRGAGQEGVPFSLRKQLVSRLSNRAIDSLKERSCVFFARLYLDDGGAIRSLLVEDIADG